MMQDMKGDWRINSMSGTGGIKRGLTKDNAMQLVYEANPRLIDESAEMKQNLASATEYKKRDLKRLQKQ